MPSKLGPHVLAGRPELAEFVQRGGRLVKLVSNHPAQEWLQHNPDVLIIGRWFDPLTAGEQWRSGIDPKQAALDYVRMQERHYREMPEIRYWEGHNEPSFGAPQDAEARAGMAWYASFEAERVRLLADRGLRAVVGNFSTGYPEVEHDNRLWEAFLPALEAAHEHKGLLGLHEYGGPFLWSGWGPFNTGVEHGECGTTPTDDDTGWLALRYRKVHRQILAPHGMGRLPIVITENGTDSVGTWCEPMFSGPWRRIKDRWLQWDGRTDPIDYWRGPERDPEIYYAEQLIWYDREMQKDAYCVGSTIFTLGNFGNPWDEFEISGTKTVRRLLDHIQADPWVGPTDPWEVVEALPDELFDGAGPGGQPGSGPGTDTDSDDDGGAITIPTNGTQPAATGALVNPGFEGDADDHETGQTPAGWNFWFAPRSWPKLPRQDHDWRKPQAQVFTRRQALGDEKTQLFKDGEACFRVVGAWRPIWWRLAQKVSGLEPNARYRFTVPVYLEPVARLENGVKVFADDKIASEARLVAKVSGRMVETGWQDGNTLSFGAYADLVLEFSPPTAEVELFVECRGRWGLQHNAFCIDAVSLEKVGPPREGGRPEPGEQQPTGVNLIRNGALEDLTRNPGNFTPDVDSNHYQAGFVRRSLSSWSPNEWPTWWVAGKGVPEFTVPQQPIKEKIHSGDRAMGAFRQFEPYHAGWWQELAVEPGATYRVEAWCRIWCTHDEAPPFMGGTPGEIFVGIGITTEASPYPEPSRAIGNVADFEGGRVDAAPALAQRTVADWNVQDWQRLTLEFTASSDRVGVIPFVDAPHGFRTQDVYFDDLALVKLEASGAGPDTDTEPAAAPNMVANADFSGAVYKPKPVLPTLQVPENWTFWYAGTRTPRVQGQEEAWRDPKTGVITAATAASDDRAAVSGGVERAFRVVGAWRSIWWALTQKVSGLEPNQPYRLSVKLLPDPILAYGEDGAKTYANKPEAGEIWLKAVSAGRKTETQRRVHVDVEPGKYVVLTHDFTPFHSSADVTVEVRSRLALVYNAWYVAEVSVRRI